MEREFSQEEADRHNALTAKAWNLIKNDVYLSDHATGQLGFLARRRIKKAIALYHQALEINPEGWSSMWALGKIHQRLGEHSESLQFFENAFRINPEQPDVAREASLAALDLGRSKAAIRYCEAAIEFNPEDPGLLCNLALAHLINQNPDQALRVAETALQRDPNDPIIANVASIIQEVLLGNRPQPTSMAELM